MAYQKACVLLARQVGIEFSAAVRQRGAAYANAAFVEKMGLGFKAKQIRQQADKELADKRKELVNRMEVNGCL